MKKNKDSAQDIFNFIREFKLVKIGNKYINMATKNYGTLNKCVDVGGLYDYVWI